MGSAGGGGEGASHPLHTGEVGAVSVVVKVGGGGIGRWRGEWDQELNTYITDGRGSGGRECWRKWKVCVCCGVWVGGVRGRDLNTPSTHRLGDGRRGMGKCWAVYVDRVLWTQGAEGKYKGANIPANRPTVLAFCTSCPECPRP